MSKRPKKVDWRVSTTKRAVVVSARTRGAAVHLAYQDSLKQKPRSTREGGWEGVSAEPVGV